MNHVGPHLASLIEHTAECPGVRRADLQAGDLVLVITRNSIYSVRVLDDPSAYLVSGGWFARRGLAPLKTSITGCTWGGCMVRVDLVAACGMHLEFGNRIVTSTILKVCVFRHGLLN